jgi:hypothetical protein
VCAGGWVGLLQHGKDKGEDLRNYLGDWDAIGRQGPLSGSAIDCPGGSGRGHLRERRGVHDRFSGRAVEDAANGRGNSGIDERLERVLVAAIGVFGADLREVIAGGFDDGACGSGARAVKLNFAGVEKLMKAAGDEGVEQSELVGVVIVEGGAIDSGFFGDVLDGDFFKTFGLHKSAQSPLQELTCAADARVANFAVGDWHVSSQIQSSKEIVHRFDNECRLSCTATVV